MKTNANVPPAQPVLAQLANASVPSVHVLMLSHHVVLKRPPRQNANAGPTASVTIANVQIANAPSNAKRPVNAVIIASAKTANVLTVSVKLVVRRLLLLANVVMIASVKTANVQIANAKSHVRRLPHANAGPNASAKIANALIASVKSHVRRLLLANAVMNANAQQGNVNVLVANAPTRKPSAAKRLPPSAHVGLNASAKIANVQIAHVQRTNAVSNKSINNNNNHK